MGMIIPPNLPTQPYRNPPLMVQYRQRCLEKIYQEIKN